MKDKIQNWFKRYWIVIWLVAVSALMMAGVSFAAYTSFNSAKRVVSTKSDSDPLFSSNLLNLELKNTNAYRYQQITATTNGDNVSFVLEIYNYQTYDVTTSNQKNINYNLIATLKPKTGVDLSGQYGSFKIGDTSFSGETLTISDQTLEGGSANTNSYVFMVPAAFKDKVDIQIEAEPDASSYDATKQKKLAAIVSMAESTAVKTWTGKFIDQQRNVDGYDGFNYEISGNGQGTVTLKWDSDKLQISPWYSSQIPGEPTQDGSWLSLTFGVGGSDQPTAYQLQFFKKKSIGGWDDLKGYVSLKFIETELSS